MINENEITKEFEKQYPETSAEFKKILNEQYLIFCKKQLDYGPDNITGGGNIENDDTVKYSLTGLYFRMNDKINRLKQLVILNKNNNVNESLSDTYQDLSVYGIINQLILRKKWNK